MKKKITTMFLKNKRVILRTDFNVPIKNGNILDDTKINKSLKTINYLLNEGASIIILSHFGRVKTEEDKLKYTLEPVKKLLEEKLNKNILFQKDILSEEAKQAALSLDPGEIMLMENTRFLDVPNNLESTLNLEVAKTIASYGEIFVMDAFSSAHRSHTSVVGIAKYLPSCLGFLASEELELLDKTLKNPVPPFTVIMGGAKVDDKLPIIKSLLPKCNHLLLSGGIANSFLSALNLSVGASLKTDSEQIIEELKKIMLEYKEKLALPLDAVVNTLYDTKPDLKNINNIDPNDNIKDIGAKTISKYKKIIDESNTIFINGTMGVYEEPEFKNGTTEIFNILKEKKEKVIIGGGDTISAVNNLGFASIFPNISSGGGAALEYIAYGSLPGIDAISEEDNIEILDL